ncbi:MAG: RagB/SusD family nutrient uptake outer membrane protein [Bacteroidales bacterium]|nr:RagB/SusD family nutrient uptake outer membrane protein [Bacteroidales bacterium]
MKKIFTYLTIIAACAAMSGCDSYLDIEKHGNMGSMESFYATDSDAEQALAAVYVGMNNLYLEWYMSKNLLSDDCWCGGGSRGDDPNYEKVNEYTFATDQAHFTDIYTYLYTVIYYSNLILDNLEPDTTVKQRCYAEAKFIRAWCHFELVTLWGTAPIVDHVLSSDEYRQGNSDPADTWAFVEQDLQEVIDSGWLPSKSGVNDDITTMRVTKELAEAMLGKAYVFQEKWSEAATMLDKVIDSGLYALYTGDYGELLHASTNNCCEAMFELQKRDDADKAWDQCTMTWCYLGWRTESFTFTGQAADEIAMGTYGFCSPQHGIYEAFLATEGVDGYRFNQSIRTAEQLEEYGAALIPGKILFGNEGYFYWKTRLLNDDDIYDYSSLQWLQWIDMRIMRYAEVLLLAAEAQYQSGNSSKALAYVNQIRDRARIPELTSITMDDIKNEKRLELCMETLRYQDLVRWGDAETVLAEQGKEIPVYTTAGTEIQFTNTEYGFKAKHKYLPIPQQEIELNPNMTQNEGW